MGNGGVPCMFYDNTNLKLFRSVRDHITLSEVFECSALLHYIFRHTNEVVFDTQILEGNADGSYK